MKSAILQPAIGRITDLAARLPWWGALLSALTAYTLLHAISVLQPPAPTGTVDLVGGALTQLLILLARIGQYLVPLTFLVAAAISGFDRWKRSGLREFVAQDTSGSSLRSLPWPDFRLLVGDAFRRQGYEMCAPRTASGSRDETFELTKDGRRFLVDCTDWRSGRAGAAAVRKLHKHMQENDVTGGFAVTSGRFAPEAKRIAAESNIGLVDGRRLKELARTEPRGIEERFSFVQETFESILARLARARRARRGMSSRDAHDQEPSIWPSSRRELGAEVRTPGGPSHDDLFGTEEAEETAGQQLAALIQADAPIEEEFRISTPPVQRQDVNPRWSWPRVGVRKIADAVGILVTISILWGIYDWYLQLPEKSVYTPWALLGTGSNAKLLGQRLQRSVRTQAAERILQGKHPLGQFQFGPPPGFLTSRLLDIPEPVAQSEEVVYHSLRELETAFIAKYVPPPECYAPDSNQLLVKCGNHRIRARRTFIENGGKVTATLLGSWEEPRAVMMDLLPQDWRQYEPDEWHQHSTWDRGRESKQDDSPGLSQEWNQELASEPDRDPQVDELHRLAPISPQEEFAQDTKWDSRQGDGQKPWTELDQGPVDQLIPEEQLDWDREGAEAPPQALEEGWRRDWVRHRTPDPEQEWRRHWKDDP